MTDYDDRVSWLTCSPRGVRGRVLDRQEGNSRIAREEDDILSQRENEQRVLDRYRSYGRSIPFYLCAIKVRGKYNWRHKSELGSGTAVQPQAQHPRSILYASDTLGIHDRYACVCVRVRVYACVHMCDMDRKKCRRKKCARIRFLLAATRS